MKNPRFKQAIEDIKNGIPIVLADSTEREDEGDIVIAAEKANTENLAFTARHARGIMCIPCEGHILDRLQIPMMVQNSTDRLLTPFTISIDAAHGITTGVPVSDRLKTINVVLDPNSKPSDLAKPGHLFPLRPHQMGIRGRQGHTEGSVELMRIAGLKPVAIISEIMNDDGTMARGKSLAEFSERHKLTTITIDDIIDYCNETSDHSNVTAVVLAAGTLKEDIVRLTGTNSSAMIPVSGKPAIYWNLSYLIGLGVKHFVIVLRPEMQNLRNYVTSLFGAVADIKFVEGEPTGGPGDSLLKGLKYTRTPSALVVLGDTVFRFEEKQEKALHDMNDFILVGDAEFPERWCMAKMSGSSVDRLIEKKAEKEAGTKALIGVYKIGDAGALKNILEDLSRRNKEDHQGTELSEGLTAYMKVKKLDAYPAGQWLDLGNPDNLIGSRKKPTAVRTYNSFEFNDLLGTVTKRSDTPKLADEIEYYKKLPNEISVLFPRLIASGQNGNTHEMTLEYYGYPNLGEFLTYGTVSASIWKRIIGKLNDITTLWSKTFVAKGNSSFAEEMYINKTEREFHALEKQSDEFKEMLNHKSLTINGKSYPNFNQVWPEVKKYIQSNLMTYNSSVIHGDCCLSNILYDLSTENIRFIDPRGSFGARGILGDIRYDAAKLAHSFEGGYEFFISDMFKVSGSGSEFNFEFVNAEGKEQPKAIFEEMFYSKFNRREIKTIQGLIYIGMCARHYDSVPRQKAMFLTGVKLLNESLSLTK